MQHCIALLAHADLNSSGSCLLFAAVAFSSPCSSVRFIYCLQSRALVLLLGSNAYLAVSMYHTVWIALGLVEPPFIVLNRCRRPFKHRTLQHVGWRIRAEVLHQQLQLGGEIVQLLERQWWATSWNLRRPRENLPRSSSYTHTYRQLLAQCKMNIPVRILPLKATKVHTDKPELSVGVETSTPKNATSSCPG